MIKGGSGCGPCSEPYDLCVPERYKFLRLTTNGGIMSQSLKLSSSCYLLSGAYKGTCLPPIFLAPLLEASPKQKLQFSSSAPTWQRRRRDGNPNRGVSPLRRTGLRYPVSMSKEPLPEPVLDPKKRSKIAVDENHGLWGFFNKDRKPYGTSVEYSSYGKLV